MGVLDLELHRTWCRILTHFTIRWQNRAITTIISFLTSQSDLIVEDIEDVQAERQTF